MPNSACPPLATQLREHDRQVVSQGEVIEFEEHFHRDESVTYASIKFPITDNNNLIGLCSISTDISERIKLQ